jgi:hypothetical protein
VTVSLGLGVGGATVGLRRDDQTDEKSVFAWNAITDVKVGITPNFSAGTKLIYYQTSTAEIGRKQFSMDGIAVLATGTHAF